MEQIEYEANPVASLHAAVNSYLSTLLAMADCLGAACPPVGGPYRHRLTSLQKRLAFDSSKEALAESCAEVGRELFDYSAKASGYLRSHGMELRRAVTGLEDIVRTLAQRQEMHVARLRQLAAQMESVAASEARMARTEPVGPRVAELKVCLEGMGRESRALLDRMREELAAVEQRLADTEITDPVTGLTNRREMERRIRAAAAQGTPPVLVRFDLGSPLANEVARQVGARISSQFRYNDVVCRWSEREFMVLFQGPADIARVRAEQVSPWVAGRYLLDTGEIACVQVDAALIDPCMVGTEPLESGLTPASSSETTGEPAPNSAADAIALSPRQSANSPA